MTPGQQQIVMSRPIDVGIGGSGLTTGMQVQGPAFDGAGFDFSYFDTAEHARIRDTVTAANNYRGPAQGKLTYTSPSAKMTLRSNGVYAKTNGSTELPYEWDAAGRPLGLRLEAAATNICLQSQTLATSPWNNNGATVTITSDTTVAPDGTTTADTVTANNAACALSNEPITVTASTAYVFSFWAKKGTATDMKYSVYNLSGSADIVASTSYNSQINSTSFTRISVSFTTPVGCTSVAVYPCRDPGVTGTVIVWGCQLELGAFASSYITTTTVSVTRAVDNITLATSALPFSATVGTLFSKFRPINTAAIRFAAAFDGAANNRIAIGSSAAAAGYFSIIATSEQIGPMTVGTAAANLDSKLAAGWVANRAEQATNGTLATVDTAVTLPTVTSLGFGTGSSAASPLNGWLMQLAYYKRTLADAELQALTRIL